MSLTKVTYAMIEGAPLNVLDFGAVGDGVVNDTTAIQAAINASISENKPLDWQNGTYKITSELTFTYTDNMYWMAQNAVISYEPAAHTYSCMTISLPTGQHQITGGLTFNINQNANVGLRFNPVTNGTDEPNLLLEDVTINEPYRKITFNDGDALLIIGSFGRVDIVRPVIKDCFMATGAGVPGTYGIFGITVTRNGSYSPKNTYIENVWIENVYSDDPTYLSDQDGIRIFSRYGGSGTGGLNNPNTFTITGGVIKNVRGRSVKGQTENGIVNGLSLYRTKAANGGVAGALTQNADIEMQTGGTTVTNIEFQYEDFVPARVVRCIQADETVRWASPSIVSNVRGVVTGSFAPITVVLYSALTTSTAFESQFVASDINVVSETPFLQIFAIGLLSGVSSAKISATFANAICPVSAYCLSMTDNATLKTISLTNITNPRGAALPLVNTILGLTLKLSNLSGFIYNDPFERAVETFTVAPDRDFYVLTRNSTTQTITLPDPAISYGSTLTFKNLGSQAVDSASANVVPINSTSPAAAIFASATPGTWASMVSNGTNWVIMQRG
jgi:hypothetical protein